MGHFPTWNITCFKCFGVFQYKLGKVTVTNETFCGNRHINLCTKHVWTHLSEFHVNIPRLDITRLGISLVSSDLVCFSIN